MKIEVIYITLPIRCQTSEYALRLMEADITTPKEREQCEIFRAELDSQYEKEYVEIITSMNKELIEKDETIEHLVSYMPLVFDVTRDEFESIQNNLKEAQKKIDDAYMELNAHKIKKK